MSDPSADVVVRERALICLADVSAFDENVRRDVLASPSLKHIVACMTDGKHPQIADLALKVALHCSFLETEKLSKKRESEIVENLEDANLIEELVDALSIGGSTKVRSERRCTRLSSIMTALGNFSCHDGRLKNEVRACGGIEDIADVVSNASRASSSSSSELVEVGLMALDNITQGNDRNVDAFVRTGLVADDLIKRVLASDRPRSLDDETELATLRLIHRCDTAATVALLQQFDTSPWIPSILRIIVGAAGTTAAEATSLATKILARCLRLSGSGSSALKKERVESFHEAIVDARGVRLALKILRTHYRLDDSNGDVIALNRIDEELVQTCWLVLGRCARQSKTKRAVVEICRSGGVEILLKIIVSRPPRDNGSERADLHTKTVGMATFLLSCCLFEYDAMDAEDAERLMDLVWGEVDNDNDDDESVDNTGRSGGDVVLALVRMLRHADTRVRRHATLCIEGLQRGPHAARRFALYDVPSRMKMIGRRSKRGSEGATIDFSVAANALRRWIRAQLCSSGDAFGSVVDRIAGRHHLERRRRRQRRPTSLSERETRAQRVRLAQALVESGALRANAERRARFVRRGALRALIGMIGRSSGGESAVAMSFLRDVRPLITAETERRLSDSCSETKRRDRSDSVDSTLRAIVGSKEDDDDDSDPPDVKFSISGGHAFVAHMRVVRRCDALRDLLRNNDTDDEEYRYVATVPDAVPYRAFKAIMTFLYTGNAARALCQDNIREPSIRYLIDLLRASRRFETTDLSDRILSELKDRLNRRTVVDLLEASIDLAPPAWDLGLASFELLLTSVLPALRGNAGGNEGPRRSDIVRALNAYLSVVLVSYGNSK